MTSDYMYKTKLQTVNSVRDLLQSSGGECYKTLLAEHHESLPDLIIKGGDGMSKNDLESLQRPIRLFKNMIDILKSHNPKLKRLSRLDDIQMSLMHQYEMRLSYLNKEEERQMEETKQKASSTKVILTNDEMAKWKMVFMTVKTDLQPRHVEMLDVRGTKAGTYLKTLGADYRKEDMQKVYSDIVLPLYRTVEGYPKNNPVYPTMSWLYTLVNNLYNIQLAIYAKGYSNNDYVQLIETSMKEWKIRR